MSLIRIIISNSSSSYYFLFIIILFFNHFFKFISDTFTDQAHVFHLHGNSFYLIGISDEEIAWKKSLQEIKNIDANGLLMKRNLERPIIKDTVTVPKQRAIALRFLADSAGEF